MSSSVDIDDRVKDEIEALEAILMDDVTVEYNDKNVPARVKTVVFPSTADDAKQQYVCITLEVEIVTGYPDREPVIWLRNPRGLDDSLIDDVHRAAKDKCAQCLGQPVIFELIELIRERLTESNVPSCQCAVCLYDFERGDQFTKTQCYHYFHSYCLASHLVNTEKQWHEEQAKLPAWQRHTAAASVPLCPVCREPICCELAPLQAAPPPLGLQSARAFEVTAELRALQARMAALYLHQQRRGGIIDADADQTKLLVLTERPTASTGAAPALTSPPPGPSAPPQARVAQAPRSLPRGLQRSRARGRRTTDKPSYSAPASR